MKFEHIIIFLAICFLGYVIYDNFIAIDKQKEEFEVEYKRNTLPLTVDNYQSLLALMKSLFNTMSCIDEVNILMTKHAEVQPSILDNMKDDYLSFDYLIAWKKFYIKNMELEYVLLHNVFSCMKDGIVSTEDYPVISKNIDDIRFFIEQQKRTV